MKIKKLALLTLILLHLWILAVTDYYDDIIVSVTSILIAAWLLSNCTEKHILQNRPLKVPVVCSPEYLPEYKTQGASGMDLKASLVNPVTLQPGAIVTIGTGVSVELPLGYEAQVRARSGLSTKYGLTVINGVGTIDADYRGQIAVPLINLGKDPVTITNEDRIAQLIVTNVTKCELEPVTKLTKTTRGTGGFGSTGK